MGVVGVLTAIGTAITNANGVFNGHPSLAYWFYGAAVVLVIVALVLAQKKTDQLRAHAEQSLTQSLANVGNPVQKTELHIHTPIAAPPLSAPIGPPTAVHIETSPNLVFLGARAINVRIEQDPRTGITRTYEDARGDFHALLATFRNEALQSRSVKPLSGVGSHLVYRDAQGREIGDGISGADWLAEGSHEADFDTGGPSRSLILILKLVHDDRLFVMWRRRTRGNWMGAGLEEEATGLPEFPSSIRVQLLEDAEVVKEIELQTNVADGGFQAKLTR